MSLASMGEGGGPLQTRLRRAGDPGGDEGRHDLPAVLAGIGQGIAGKVHSAALPRGMAQLGDGGLEALMGVGDDQLDPRAGRAA